MINEVLQWVAIAVTLFLLVYPSLKQIIKDFKSEEEE